MFFKALELIMWLLYSNLAGCVILKIRSARRLWQRQLGQYGLKFRSKHLICLYRIYSSILTSNSFSNSCAGALKDSFEV